MTVMHCFLVGTGFVDVCARKAKMVVMLSGYSVYKENKLFIQLRILHRTLYPI